MLFLIMTYRFWLLLIKSVAGKDKMLSWWLYRLNGDSFRVCFILPTRMCFYGPTALLIVLYQILNDRMGFTCEAGTDGERITSFNIILHEIELVIFQIYFDSGENE